VIDRSGYTERVIPHIDLSRSVPSMVF